MAVDVEARAVTSSGMRRWVRVSMGILSAESWRSWELVITSIGTAAAGVGGMVVLRARSVGSAMGSRKCLQMGQETDVEVWP